jgi:hypothetical protein
MAIDSYTLTTARLGLREWIGADTGPSIEMNKDPEVMKFYPKALSDEESIAMIKRIERSFADNWTLPLKVFLRPASRSAGVSKRKYGETVTRQKRPMPVCIMASAC